jgi:hypothetical protein
METQDLQMKTLNDLQEQLNEHIGKNKPRNEGQTPNP